MNYSRFLAMIATSTAIMLGLMYLNSYSIIEHAFWSETRFYMAFVMGAAMAVAVASARDPGKRRALPRLCR